MTAPTHTLDPTADRTTAVALDATTAATADIATPEPAPIDRSQIERARGAQLQRTLGNRMARHLAQRAALGADRGGDDARAIAARADDPRTRAIAARVDADHPAAPHFASPSGVPAPPASPSRPPSVTPPPADKAIGVPTPKPPSPAPARTMSDVQEQVARAATAIPHPVVGGYTAAQQAIRAQGFRLASARGAAAAPTRSHVGGGAVHDEHPDRPHEPDPVPKESKALVEAAKKHLDEVVQPIFVESPQHHMPKLGARALTDDELKILKTNGADDKALIALDQQRLAERAAKREKEGPKKEKAADKAKRMAAKPDENEPQTYAEMRMLIEGKPWPQDIAEQAKKKTAKATAKGKHKDKDAEDGVPTYEEPPPPGPIVFDPAHKDNMRKALAGLKAEPERTAHDILNGIRRSVVSTGRLIGPTLAEVFPSIGEMFRGQVVTAFSAKVADLQKGAGVTEAELDKAVAARKAELARIRAEAAKGKSQAQMEADRVVADKAREEAATIAAKKEAADAKHRVVKRVASKAPLPMDVLPMDIDARKTRLLGYVVKDVADLGVKMKQKGDIRTMTVARMAHDYIEAYKFAAQQDDYAITQANRDPKAATSVATGNVRDSSRRWLADRTKEIEKFRDDHKKADEANVARLQAGIQHAGTAKSEAIRAWAERTSGKKRSESQKAADRAINAAAQQKSNADALAQLEKSRLALGVSRDFDLVDAIGKEVQAGHDRETIVANLHLNATQTAILDAYLKPPEPGDERALSGVMAGMRMRIQMELTGDLAPKIEQQILLLHDYDTVGLDRLGAAQTPGFSAATIAQKVHAAVDKVNTDEDAVYEALADLTPIQVRAIRLAYMQLYDGNTIDGDIKGGYVYGMSGSELERAQRLLRSDQKGADAVGYRIALKGNEGAWYHLDVGHGDSEALDKINHGKTPEERQAAEDEYNLEHDSILAFQIAAAPDEAAKHAVMQRYRESGHSKLIRDANDSLATDRQKERFKASVAGDDDTADMLELRDHLPSPQEIRDAEQRGRYAGQSGVGNLAIGDRKKVEAVYDRIRTEATKRGDREHWTTAEIEAEIARRTHKIEGLFDGRFGADYEVNGKGALRTAFDVGFRHHEDEIKLANGLADNDRQRVDAAKIHIEHRGLWASDSVENEILQQQYQRALADTRRDALPLQRVLMAREMAKEEKDARAAARLKYKEAHKNQGPDADEGAEQAAQAAWTGKDQWAARERLQRGMDRMFEQSAREKATGNMNALRDSYRSDYGGNLDEVVASDTSGYSGRKAEALLKGNGYLTLGETMFYAIRGPGTDDDALKTLKGHTKAEIDVARKEFRALAIADSKTTLGKFNAMWDGPDVDQTNMDTEIAADISGRTGFDVGQMLKGEPETIDEKRERLLEAISWEKEAGPLGRTVAGGQTTALDSDLARLDQTIKKLEDPNLTSEQRDIYLGFFEQDVATVDAGITAHREMLDTWTDRITTAVGLIVGVAVTILTFGAAGVVLAAVLGSILATASTIALKYAIQGKAYGWEDLTTDIVVGIVDAIAAALTAGMGSKLLGAAKAGAPAASRFAFGRAIQRLLGTGGRLAIINPAEGALARAIPTSTLLKEMVEKGGISKILAVTLAEGGENLIAATPSALAGSMLDPNNYKDGNVVGNILGGTFAQAGQSAGIGLGMKAGMHGVTSVREKSGEMFRALRTPEAPSLYHFELVQKQFPTITYEEFTKLRAAAIVEMRLRQTEIAQHPAGDGEPRAESARDASFASSSGERSSERLPMAEQHAPGDEIGVRREGEGHPPGSDPASPTEHADITAPREMSEAQVRELLPAAIRDSASVRIDPTESAGTVKVERIKRLGVVVDVHLVVGPHVRPIDVVLHIETLHAMRRYLGVTGVAVRAVERMRSLIARDGMPPFGSKAWNAFHELNKLPRIIEQRLEMLRTGNLDPRAEAEIHADLEHLGKQVDEHRAALERMDKSPGVDFIAMQGKTPAPAPPPTDVRENPRERRDHPSIERYAAEHSALQEKFPDAQFLTVGPPWKETKAEGTRIYRVLEVRNAETGDVLVVREEIQSLDKAGHERDHWVQRGSESNVGGASAEEGFRLEFEADQRAGERTGQVLLPAEVIQRAGGQGFDGVIIHFENGKATIILVEVKNYPNHYVPRKDITAIHTSLNDNLTHLEGLLTNRGERERLGLTKEQAKLALNAIAENRLKFEMQLGDTTRLGKLGNSRASVLQGLLRGINTELGTNFGPSRIAREHIAPEHMAAGRAIVEARERLEALEPTRPAKDKSPSAADELRELAKGHDSSVTVDSVRHAEAALAAQQGMPGLVKPPLEIGPAGHTFVDAKQNPYTVVAPERGASAPKIAKEIAQTLRETAARPGKATRVIVDVANLSAGQQKTLRNELRLLANKKPGLKLDRVIAVDTSTGVTKPLFSPRR